MHRAIAAFALLLVACGSGGSDALADTEWRLTSLGPAADPAPVVSGSEATAEFSQDEVRGSTGCNSYSGGYSASGISFSTGDDLSWTERACGEVELMQQEDRFIDLLIAAESYVLSGDELRISSEDGQSALVFTRSRE